MLWRSIYLWQSAEHSVTLCRATFKAQFCLLCPLGADKSALSNYGVASWVLEWVSLACQTLANPPLFNALTKTAKAQAANFPFCTIEPNVGEVNVPDVRLDKLATYCKI